MPALSLSSWNFSTVTLASNKSQRNKLRRRRRPPPLRDMSAGANGDHHNGAEVVPPMPTPTTATSTARSTSPTLLEKHISEPRERDSDKDDAQAQVITSLRAQITDLISQVSQLNGKLVKSYDRVSDLEDELHVASSTARTTSLKITELEIERAQHLAALNTGLYVEKAHVTSELTRLMERATSEAAARGQAESARQNIEKELDDLSASLFDQANTMVAEARLARAMSERKVVDAEMALKSAEEAVGVMQLQTQALRDEKDRTYDDVSRLRALMEKGKFIERVPMLAPTSLKLLSLHTPYQEFTQFIVHLRSLRHSVTHPPHISTLLPLPFLARIQTEDSDPTVRLDFAPSLNWLSRRSVISAIHCGQLTIEPTSVTAFLSESTLSIQSMIGGLQSNVVCALCGAHVFPSKLADGVSPPPTHPLSSLSLARHTSSNVWSSSIFKNPLSSAAPSPPLTPPPRDASSPATPTSANAGSTIYVFRLSHAQPPHNSPSGFVVQSQAQTQKMTSYPLCTSGWCLARLRTTCSLWAYIRAGLIDRVWEEESSYHAHGAPSLSSASAYSVISTINNGSTPNLAAPAQEKEPAPPLPPRRRSKMSSSVGALWGMASGALRSATPVQGQPASLVQNGSKEKEEESPEALEKSETLQTKMEAPKPLRVTVPPPLPRRNLSRRVTGNEGTSDEKNADEEAAGEQKRPSPLAESNYVPTSPTDGTKSETSMSDKTPVARSRSVSPGPRAALEPEKMSLSISQASSAGVAEEFSTPVEEMNSFPPSSSASATDAPARPTTPHSPPRSPPSNKRNSMSPPRSPASRPQRVSSPPPPRSPRAIPLPDSRPGTPASPQRLHARSPSANVTVAPLNISGDSTSRPPSRSASPNPGATGTGAPPPLPRRAAARRAIPPPPSAFHATPPSSSGSVDEKTGHTQRSSSDGVSPQSNAEHVSKSENEETKPPLPVRADVRRPPPVHPRRADHVVHNSVSDLGKGDEDDRMESLQGRSRREKPEEDRKDGDATEGDASKKLVGDATWEERTWKEIVRLREDMFWARVGAIRE